MISAVQAATAPTAYCMLALQCKQLPLLMQVLVHACSAVQQYCMLLLQDGCKHASDRYRHRHINRGPTSEIEAPFKV